MNQQNNSYRTRTGRVVTHTELNALAEEAERGYDVDELARRPGRPRLGSAAAIVVPVRLHAQLHVAVKRRASAERTSISDLVRCALDVYLRSEPPTLATVRTRTGRVLGESELDALASEAEVGYDPKVKQPRSAHSRRADVVPVRLPPELKTAVERRAELEATSVSEIIRDALRAYLADDMAQRAEINFVDDLDGSPANTTVSFAIDGTSYEIDLTTAHAQEFRDAVQPFIAAARRTGRSGRRARASRPGDRRSLSSARAS